MVRLPSKTPGGHGEALRMPWGGLQDATERHSGCHWEALRRPRPSGGLRPCLSYPVLLAVKTGLWQTEIRAACSVAHNPVRRPQSTSIDLRGGRSGLLDRFLPLIGAAWHGCGCRPNHLLPLPLSPAFPALPPPPPPPPRPRPEQGSGTQRRQGPITSPG